MTPQEERRFKQIILSPNQILALFRAPPFELDSAGLWHWVTFHLVGDLKGAAVASVNYDNMRQAFVLTLVSSAFAIVPVGEYPPLVQMQYEIVKLAVHRQSPPEKPLAGL